MGASMSSNFRNVPGTRRDWVDTRIAAGFSNFLFIDENYLSNPILRRLFSLARKHGYQSLLIDRIAENDCSLLAEENVALRTRNPSFHHSEVHRFSFFRSLANQEPTQADFLGYAVFKTDIATTGQVICCHVYESVMPAYRQAGQNNFIHCNRLYHVSTSAGNFSVSGSLYAQQNGWTFVCAHVAVRSVLSCLLPDADITYAQMNALAGIDHGKNPIGGDTKRGLAPEGIERILDGVGYTYEKLVHEPTENLILPVEFSREMYGFVESGWPALVGFELTGIDAGRHMIPVVGHTFNEDTWAPEAQRAYFANRLRYYSSENWLSTYVIHDDNFGPYFCIPRNFLTDNNFRVLYGLRRFPAVTSAVDVEAWGLGFLRWLATTKIQKLGINWYDRFVVFCRSNMLVLRTIFVGKEDYSLYLKNLTTWNGVAFEDDLRGEIEALLPDHFWMVEVSCSELFASSRRKFGEIILRADDTNLDHTFIAIRLPGIVGHKTVQDDIEFKNTKLQGHTDLFTYTHQGCSN